MWWSWRTRWSPPEATSRAGPSPSGEPAARWLAGRLFDAFAGAGDGDGGGATFPASAPSARIDYLFAGGGLRVVECRVAEGPGVRAASDHLPVIGAFEVSEAP